jgi:hypothetical protein
LNFIFFNDFSHLRVLSIKSCPKKLNKKNLGWEKLKKVIKAEKLKFLKKVLMYNRHLYHETQVTPKKRTKSVQWHFFSDKMQFSPTKCNLVWLFAFLVWHFQSNKPIFSPTKCNLVRHSYFSKIFLLKQNLFFKNSGKSTRFSFNKVLIHQKFRQNYDIFLEKVVIFRK